MLKILTLNANGAGQKHGPWARRRPLLARVIEKNRADVVALQAVCRASEGGNQAEQLAAELNGFRVAFETADDETTTQGVAFLARPQLAALDRLRLARRAGHDDPFQRLVLAGRLQLADGPLWIVNGHLSWVPQQALENVTQILEWTRSMTGPILLAGDFNSAPDSQAMGWLCAGGWHDAWARLNSDRPGHTFESDRPSMRIDYVWANAAARERLVAIEIVGQQAAEDGVRPSDHFGLLATLDMSA